MDKYRRAAIGREKRSISISRGSISFVDLTCLFARGPWRETGLFNLCNVIPFGTQVLPFWKLGGCGYQLKSGGIKCNILPSGAKKKCSEVQVVSENDFHLSIVDRWNVVVV